MEQPTQGHTTSKLVVWAFNPRQSVANAQRGNVLYKQLMLRHFLNLVNFPSFLGWGGVCVECGGIVKEKLRRGRRGVYPVSLFFSELVSDTIVPHDSWVRTHISSLRCYHLINVVRIID